MIKTVVITGGTQGIGAAIAKTFHGEGMHVFLGARHDNGLARKLGNRAWFYSIEVRRERDHVKIARKAIEKTGRLDVYINCAGYSQWRPIQKVDEKFWCQMLDTNLKGTFWGCKTACRFLSTSGCIINISSIAGKRGSANNAVYCASKFGVTGLTQALAKELGGRGIRVNAVCPVYVQSPGLLKALRENSAPASGKNVEAYLKKFASEQAALKRLPTGIEVAQACLFLASDKAAAITGQSINVDCGVLPQ